MKQMAISPLFNESSSLCLKPIALDTGEFRREIAVSICESIARTCGRMNMGKAVLLDCGAGEPYEYCSYLNDVLKTVSVEHPLSPLMRIGLNPMLVSEHPSVKQYLPKVMKPVFLYPCEDAKKDYTGLLDVPNSLHIFFHEEDGHVCGLTAKYVPNRLNRNKLKRLRKKGR